MPALALRLSAVTLGFQPLVGCSCFECERSRFHVALMPRTAQAARINKLQRAGRDFLIRLIAKHGLVGAARVLRALADELGSPNC
jgi:hypothetical protein